MSVVLDEKELAELRRCKLEWAGKTLTVNVVPNSLVVREPGPPPPMLFLVVTDKIGEDEEGVIGGDMHMVGYACMELLPKEMRQKIRDILRPQAETGAEVEEVETATLVRVPAPATPGPECDHEWRGLPDGNAQCAKCQRWKLGARP